MRTTSPLAAPPLPEGCAVTVGSHSSAHRNLDTRATETDASTMELQMEAVVSSVDQTELAISLHTHESGLIRA